MRGNALLVLALGLLAVAGCSSNNAGKIEGTKWISEAVNTNGHKAPEGTMQLEFNQDGTLVFWVEHQQIKGTYTLSSGDTVTLHLDKYLEGKKDHPKRISISGERMTVTEPDGTQVSYRKISSN